MIRFANHNPSEAIEHVADESAGTSECCEEAAADHWKYSNDMIDIGTSSKTARNMSHMIEIPIG